VALSNGGTGDTYLGSIPTGSVAGNGALYLTASTPQGLSASAVTRLTVTGHNLSFAGTQRFPSPLKQSATGTVTVNVRNEAFVAERTTLDVADVTSGTPALLARSEVSVPSRAVSPFAVSFPAATLAAGPHTLRVSLTPPAGE